jgi:hypothetical protein
MRRMLSYVARQDSLKVLSLAFEKCNRPVYTMPDKHSFATALLKSLAACQKSDRPKSYIKKLTGIFDAMLQKTEDGTVGCIIELGNVVDELTDVVCNAKASAAISVDGGQARGGNHIWTIDKCLLNAKDIQLRSSFDMEIAFRNFSELGSSPSLSHLRESIAAEGTKVEGIIQLLGLLTKVGSAMNSLQHATDPKQKTAGISKLIAIFTDIRKAAGALDLDEVISGRLAGLEKACDVHSVGKEQYLEHLEAFRGLLAGVMSSVCNMQAGEAPRELGEAGGEAKHKVETTTKELVELSHSLHQLAAWSDTPNHDASCIDLVTADLAKVFLNAHGMLQCIEKPPEDYTPDAELVTAMSTLCNLEMTKPKLTWLGGAEEADSFLKFLQTLSEKWCPLNDRHLQQEQGKLQAVMKKLEALLVDEGLCDSDFMVQLNSARMNKVRQLRSDAKAALGSVTASLGPAAAAELKLAGMQATILRAKCQTVKWGLLTFMRNSDINASTAAGESLRKQMGNVWAMYATDADILDYMGKENADMIKKIFEARDQGGKKRGAAGAQVASAAKGAAKKPKAPA